jgi:hypothetical protein
LVGRSNTLLFLFYDGCRKANRLSSLNEHRAHSHRKIIVIGSKSSGVCTKPRCVYTKGEITVGMQSHVRTCQPYTIDDQPTRPLPPPPRDRVLDLGFRVQPTSIVPSSVACCKRCFVCPYRTYHILRTNGYGSGQQLPGCWAFPQTPVLLPTRTPDHVAHSNVVSAASIQNPVLLFLFLLHAVGRQQEGKRGPTLWFSPDSHLCAGRPLAALSHILYFSHSLLLPSFKSLFPSSLDSFSCSDSLARWICLSAQALFGVTIWQVHTTVCSNRLVRTSSRQNSQ